LALGHFFLKVLSFPIVTVIPAVFWAHMSFIIDAM